MHYIVACWTGERYAQCPRYAQERTYYLREHVASLQRLTHQLQRITVVLAHGDDDMDAAARAVLPTEIRGVPVEVRVRQNVGFSYGAYADVIADDECSESFILMEDDYIFTTDDFDSVLQSYLQPHVGMVCGALWATSRADMDGPQPHAAVFLGLVRGTVAREIVGHGLSERIKRRASVVAPPATPYETAWMAQVDWSWSVLDAGYELADWLDDRATAFWSSMQMDTRIFSRTNANADTRHEQTSLTRRSLVVPLQTVGVPARLSDGKVFHQGVLGFDGRITVL